MISWTDIRTVLLVYVRLSSIQYIGKFVHIYITCKTIKQSLVCHEFFFRTLSSLSECTTNGQKRFVVVKSRDCFVLHLKIR